MEISDRHVEWAVVNRLKAMLETPPKTEFNVTQSFAIFSTVVLWTKQRAWAEDPAAHKVRGALGSKIFDDPWRLSKVRPQPKRGEQNPVDLAGSRINSDFQDMNAEEFFEWLRNALAHGDGRSIKPLHNRSQGSNKTSLAGFEIVPEKRSKLHLTLYHSDMTRIGRILADVFCKELSGGDKYFEQEAGTATITEAA